MNGEKISSVFPSTDSQKSNISIPHGITAILTNGSTEEVLFHLSSVEVGGRPLHRDQCLVPNIVNGADGFEYIVPLLVKEDADRSNQQGLILSKGFLPYNFKDIGTRYRI